MALSNDRPNPSLRGTATNLQGRGGEWGDGGRNGRRGVRSYAPTLTVTLTDEEIFLAMTHAVVRYTNRIRANSKPVNKQERSLEADAVGAVSELAVAKALNKFFPAGFRETDVGEYEVRATTRKDGSLIIRERDSSAKRYILAIVDLPRVIIAGYVWGWDAKKPEYWRAPNGRPGAYFVPQSALRPLEDK
ncbi:MAG: hypothetical protein QXX19_09365 [Candidatus Caldarchaeum sp.]